MSVPPIPAQLLEIDEATRGEYYYLQQSDCCYYLWERMSGLFGNHAMTEPSTGNVVVRRYADYPANGLISNLQKAPGLRDTKPLEYRYKEKAIEYAAMALARTIPPGWKEACTFVPMPPSVVKGAVGYDPRMYELLTDKKYLRLPDVRELVELTCTVPSKAKGKSPEERRNHYRVCPTAEPIKYIILVDDVLTTGSHFKAVQNLLETSYPGVWVGGVFLTRAVRQGSQLQEG